VGRGIAIETKRPKKNQQDQQKQFQKAWEKAGGFYLVARGVEEAVREVQNLHD